MATQANRARCRRRCGLSRLVCLLRLPDVGRQFGEIPFHRLGSRADHDRPVDFLFGLSELSSLRRIFHVERQFSDHQGVRPRCSRPTVFQLFLPRVRDLRHGRPQLAMANQRPNRTRWKEQDVGPSPFRYFRILRHCANYHAAVCKAIRSRIPFAYKSR